jgi:TP901 family phage tail tape measure protein
MPLRIPTVQTGLEASIEAAAKKAGRNLKINLGAGAKSIEGLSQPLGRITGKADQFTKSMEAANARVLAFGASVGVLSAVSRGFKELITTTIEVEKSLASINSILGATGAQLDSFKKTIFSVARETEQSFTTVSQAALELSRQGLKTEEVIGRLNDAMILSRLSGLGATEAVFGLTAAINSFNKTGITSSEVLNKLGAAAVSAAVSERDLIEGIKRSGSVAIQAGVSFDELIGVITAVQQKTARGGAVIGNSFKTIFTRIQSLDKLQTMQNLGVQVTDAAGEVLSGTKLIQNLGKAIKDLPDAKQLQISEKLVGKFQIAPFLAILDDYNSKTSTAIKVTEVAAGATNEAYTRNIALNQTLSAAINSATVNLKELANTLGEIGVTDSLKNILGFFNSLVTNIKDLMQGEGLGSDFARGIVKGISNVISGPGLAIFAAIIAKLTIDLVRFGTSAISTFFGLNKSVQQLAATQGQIASTLLGNKSIQDQILAIENSTLTIEQKRVAQTKFFTVALNEQLAVMTRMQAIATRVAPGVIAGTKGGGRRAAGGYIPNFDAVRGYGSESQDIKRGVGGAPSSARPVAIPNFNFGGGQRGTVVANSSEVMVPNFAGGGSAIFNKDMVGAMGMPSGARKIGAAGGYIPNFAIAAATGLTRATAGLTLNQAIATNQFSRPQLTSGFTKGAVDTRLGAVSKGGKPVGKAGVAKTGVLRVSGEGLGVVSLFNKKVTSNSSATLKGDSANPGVQELLKRGVTGIEMKGIRLSSLDNMRKDRGGYKESENRRAISRLFLESLTRYGSEILGKTFSNDELNDARKALSKQSKKKSAALFSSSVEGGIFESAIGLATKGAGAIQDFGGYEGERKPFDFEEGGPATEKFRETFFKGQGIRKADAKRTASAEAVQTIIFKALNDPGAGGERSRIMRAATQQGFLSPSKRKGRNKAGGYIPNFAGNPLSQAVERERSAGLPINQIRINQDGGLRNAANPQGLAVTNMRDEPMGRVPNFAPKGSPAGMNAGFGGLMMNLLILQSGFMMLSGILGQVTEDNKAVSLTLKALNVALAAFMMSTALGGPKKIGSFLSGGMGRGMQQGARTQLRGGLAPGFGTTPAKGMAKFKGSLKMAAGGLVALAGPLVVAGAAAGAAYLAYKHLGSSAGNLEKAQKSLAEVTKRTAEEISKLRLPEWMKKPREKSLEAGVKEVIAKTGVEGTGRNLRGGSLAGPISGVRDADLIKAFKEQVAKTLDSGVALPSVLKAIEAPLARSKKKDTSFLGIGGNQIRQEDFMAMIANVKELEGKTNLPQSVIKMLEDISPSDQAAFGTVQAAQEELFRMGGSPEKDEAFRKFSPEAAAERDRLRGQVRNVGVPEDLDFETVFQQAVSVSGPGGQQKMAKTQQMRASLVKAQVKGEIELAKIRGKGADALDEELGMATVMKSLNNTELIDLKNKIALRNVDRKSNEGIADVLIKNVDTIEKLTISDRDRAKFLEKIQGLTMEELATDWKREEVLKEITTITGMTLDQAKIFLQNADSAVLALKAQGKAEKDNLNTKTKQVKKQSEFNRLLQQGIKLSNLQAERATFAATGKDELRKIQIGAELKALDRSGDVGALTATEKQQQAERLLTELDELNIKKADADALEAFTKALNDLALKIPLLVKNVAGVDHIAAAQRRVREAIAGGADVSTAIGAGRKSLQTAVDDDRFGLLSSLDDPLSVQGGQLQEMFFKSEQGTQALTDKLTAIEAGAADRPRAAAAADDFLRLSALMKQFGDSLEEVDEKLKFEFLSARSGTEMISAIRNRREQQAMGKVKGDSAGIAGVTKDFALEEFEQQVKFAPTRAERRDLQRQREFILESFGIKQRIAELSKDDVKNATELKKAQDELLDIEEKRLQVNESINAKLENAFIFSQRDIKNQLGDNLVNAAKNFSSTMSDALVDSIAKGKDLGETLKMAAADFFLDMAKANMKAAFQSTGNLIFGGGMQSGGMVTGGSGRKDDIPTMLMGGEFVMNKQAVRKYGPTFLDSLNAGTVGGMARGGLFTPGTYGQGAITGKDDLLNFATQPYTTGAFDKVRAAGGSASVDLEPQSGRLTMWGRRNSLKFKTEQDSKRDAFGLYQQQMNREKAAKEQEEENKKAFKNSLKAFLITAAAGWVLGGGIGKLKEKGGLKGLFSGGQNQYGYEGRNNLPYTGPSDALFNDPYAALPYHTGGPVRSYATGGPVPAMLEGGEFVMNAAATQNVGRGTLAALNGGAGSRGDDEIVSRLDDLINVSEEGARGESVFNITVNSDGTETQDGGNGEGQQHNLALRIKDVVKQTIDDEKRLGGSLRQGRMA